jgi:hypothetical protein
LREQEKEKVKEFIFQNVVVTPGKFVPSLPADSPATVTISGSPEQLQPEFRKIQGSWSPHGSQKQGSENFRS